MFDIGFQELIVIFLVALLVVGPKKLPELSRKLGKYAAEIRKGFYNAKLQIEAELDEIEKKPAKPAYDDDNPPPEEEKTTENGSDNRETKE